MPDSPTIALYGFRSKQEYIYRTNRIKEITGASELIAGLFADFLDGCPLDIEPAWRGLAWSGLGGRDGAVVYEGGGNLCVLYRDRQTYLRANEFFSRLVLERSHALGLLAAGVESTDDFSADIASLHALIDNRKRVGGHGGFCNVLPYTLIDRASFQPIVERGYEFGEPFERSAEALCKRRAFDKKAKDASWQMQGKFIDELGDEHGQDSLIAVLYFDGNAIGERLKEATRTSGGGYAAQIDAMRRFSAEVHGVLVENTLAAIGEALQAAFAGSAEERTRRRASFRTVIDHGDEITLIANAHAVPTILKAYFGALEGSGYCACAGVAVCHAHDPFSAVYEIAEQCCESAKSKSRSAGGASCVDFHFCRSGITGSLDQIRAAQEAGKTLRPYTADAGWRLFCEAGERLRGSELTRADVKSLGAAVLRARQDAPVFTDSRYYVELQRAKAKSSRSGALEQIEAAAQGASLDAEGTARLLFDVSGFYDVWFDASEEVQDGR